MRLERIESKSLAHYSYLVGDGNGAIVIDPRRDCDVYIEKASQEGCRISYILETHSNEDYAIGSVELSARTGAEIWHADAQLGYQYGKGWSSLENWQAQTSGYPYTSTYTRLNELSVKPNALESFNRQLRKVTKNRSLFPDDTSALKLLYLATQEVLKKWTIKTRDWSKILAQLSIHFEERLTTYL